MNESRLVKRILYGVVFSALGLATAQAGETITVEAHTPRNFVILFADDLGYGDIGCFGAAQHPEVVDGLLALIEKARVDIGDHDRIGENARFFDPQPRRSDIKETKPQEPQEGKSWRDEMHCLEGCSAGHCDGCGYRSCRWMDKKVYP